jgi:hypothetical protein
MTEATITQVTGAGTWDSPNGILYKFAYSFDDGITLTAQHKTETPRFKEGEKVGYEITKTNQYGSLGKVHKLDAAPFQPSKSKGSNGSFALSYAKDVYIGLYGAKEPAEVAQDITDLADIFKTWLDNN